MACWTDYPASGWGTYDNTWRIGLSVPAGTRDLLLRNMVFPEAWTRPFVPARPRSAAEETPPQRL